MFCSKRNILGNLKAQFTLVSLIMVFIMLLIFAKMYPIMEPFITELVDSFTASGDPMSALLMSLIPFFIVVAIIMSVLWYIVPKRAT